jgi:hypothetical protein
MMRQFLELQDIEEMRREAGIDDVELRVAIRELQVGDVVKISVLRDKRGRDAPAFETLSVRITSIRGSAFRGKFTSGQIAAGLTKAHVGPAVAFDTAHIHSIARKAGTNDQ